MSLKQTNTETDETKRNKSNEIFLFDVLKLFVDLMIWCEFVVVCNFYFFLSSDVSTFQKNDYCKNHSKINELIDSKKHEDRLLIKCRKLEKKNRQLTECRLISTNKKIDYWLNIDWFRRTRKSTVDWNVVQTDSLTNWFRKNLQLSRFVDLKMLYVNFSFNSRKRHVSWLFSEKFHILTIFF